MRFVISVAVLLAASALANAGPLGIFGHNSSCSSGVCPAPRSSTPVLSAASTVLSHTKQEVKSVVCATHCLGHRAGHKVRSVMGRLLR